MGEAKQRQYSREQFLREHPTCCYCGAPATTTDHCPPRALFAGRRWPQGMEFPSCEPCNAKDRLAEQVVAILLRPSLVTDAHDTAWEKTLRSVKLNHPDLEAEWNSLSRNEMRRKFRDKFGAVLGDALREREFGIVHIGPLTAALLEQWAAKLGQAIFYKVTGRRCTGRVWVARINMLAPEADFDRLIAMTPMLAESVRESENLSPQFHFRYNASPDEGIVFALARAREQFGVVIAALDEPSASRFAALTMAPRMHCLVCPP
ncbi:hypothetical protein WDZ11_00020 (plasmid) [Roseomonas mucosa]|uniref:hypothetical protein n=1 Tax=Roseomonas mucosa TaxID=207340 RepID=UPI0030CACEFC